MGLKSMIAATFFAFSTLLFSILNEKPIIIKLLSGIAFLLCVLSTIMILKSKKPTNS